MAKVLYYFSCNINISDGNLEILNLTVLDRFAHSQKIQLKYLLPWYFTVEHKVSITDSVICKNLSPVPREAQSYNSLVDEN